MNRLSLFLNAKLLVYIYIQSFLFSLHTHGFASSACGFGVLTSDFKSPFVTDTLVASNFVQSFDVFSQLGFEDVGCHLKILALLVITLSVQKPSGDSMSFRVIDDVGNTITLSFS